MIRERARNANRKRRRGLCLTLLVAASLGCGPASNGGQSDSAIRKPDSAIRESDSAVRKPDSAIQEPAAAIRKPDADAPPRQLAVRVVATYPHDPAAWTQGLLLHEGRLYESVGHYGRSGVRRVNLEDGAVELATPLDERYFGEGLARAGGTLYQLTWRAGVARSYNLESLQPARDFRYEGQGWGLCWDGRRLVRSDGTGRLFFHRREDFAPLGWVEVRAGSNPVGQLNELECVDGWVYANVWTTDSIVRIDPASGRVDAVIDASGLLDESERQGADVLNGIAHNAANGSFYLTGKLWPKLFEVVWTKGGGGADG